MPEPASSRRGVGTRYRRRAQGDYRVTRYPFHLQVLIRQGQPQFSRRLPWSGYGEGLRILGEVKSQLGLPILTDVHEDTPMNEVADVVDVLQTPAFLCRQTNFILNVAAAGKPVNIKKGQFLSPWEMQNVVDKASRPAMKTSW